MSTCYQRDINMLLMGYCQTFYSPSRTYRKYIEKWSICCLRDIEDISKRYMYSKYRRTFNGLTAGSIRAIDVLAVNYRHLNELSTINYLRMKYRYASDILSITNRQNIDNLSMKYRRVITIKYQHTKYYRWDIYVISMRYWWEIVVI